MFRNYLKTLWRNLIRNKAYSALNILGLSIGIGVALVIGLWVHYQYTYDKFLPGYSRVYQVRRHFYGNGDTLNYGGTSLKLATVLREQIPEIEYLAETDGFGMHGLMVADKKFYIEGGQVGDDFPKIFPYRLLEGEAGSVLKDPYSIVLTRSTAKALFGNEDPLNKVVRFDDKNDLKVTGVLEDVPSNSTLQFKYLVPFNYLESTDSWVKEARTAGFGWTNFVTYIKLRPGASYSRVASKVKDLEKTETDNFMSMATNVILDPLARWHLYDRYDRGKEVGGFITYVNTFATVGILVLLIACINFINLTTAKAEKRAKEVGVRKSIGSSRSHLVIQFLAESVFMTFLAFLLSLLFVEAILPAFNNLTEAAISIPFFSPGFWLIAIACVLATGLVAGSRPAFYLSSFQPARVLKGSIRVGKAATLPRKILVVAQFSCSVALIICTCIIYQQVQYAKDRPTGYDRDRLMMTDMNEHLGHNYNAIRDALMGEGIANRVTTASARITTSGNHRDVEYWPGKQPGESVDMGVISVSDDYFKTMEIPFKEGRDFNGSSDTLSVIFNEAAVKLLRLQDPLNQTITWIDRKLRIVGIVKNALMSSPFEGPEPTIFLYDPNPQHVIMYRLSPGIKTQDAITKLTAIFNRYNPAYPYTYEFADDSYAAKFKLELLIGKLAGLFAVLAVFISCLGLFGLAAYTATQRTKEIGIRKALGASVTQVWLLLTKDFVVLVLISCAIASPVAFYYIQGWLQNYDYRINVSPVVFVLVGVAAILITVITISFQSIKAAIANPVKSLRME